MIKITEHGMNNVNSTDYILCICQILEKHGSIIEQCVVYV